MHRLIVIFFLLIPFFSLAKEFNVASADELKKIMNSVKAGDVIIWRAGEFKNQHISFQPTHMGNPKEPIRLKAEFPGKVRLYGDSYLNISGSYLEVDGFLFQGECTLNDKQHVIRFSQGESNSEAANYCRVTNCAVIDYTLTEESGITNSFVALEGTHNELDHCYFKGKVNKGPTVIVNYLQINGYEEGSDQSPSTYHHIHHNYFGYRTFSSNGGEQLRIGVSTTSGTKGFNIIEYNFFEDTRKEAEVISNKSCSNIYRYNLLFNNDGALVMRHGTDCLVYGNYINGKSGRGQSGGIRVVNSRQTVFNNLIDNVEGSSTPLKAPLVIMSGFKGAQVNEYAPADHAIVDFNLVRNSVGPAIKIGVCNASKGKECQAPINVHLMANIVINTGDDETGLCLINDKSSEVFAKKNYYCNSILFDDDAFIRMFEKDVFNALKDNDYDQYELSAEIAAIKKRAKTFSVNLTTDDIVHFNADKIPSRSDVGVSWLKK